jgi:hypothetical protein
VESTIGVIQVGVENEKQGVFGRMVRIGVSLRFWKHGIHCDNENSFGFFLYLPYHGAPNDNEVHRCVMFNGTGVLFSM